MLGGEASQTHCFNLFFIQIAIFSLATKKGHILTGICNDALTFMGRQIFLLNFMLFAGAHYVSND